MTTEQGDSLIRFADLSGKGITMPARKVDAGIPVVRSTDLSGKGTVFPASKIEAGDKVIRLADLSGKGIVVRADGGGTGPVETEAVDPLKSLTAIVDPLNPSQFIIEWKPGANNDECEIDINVDGGFPLKPRTGEDYATWPVVTPGAFMDWYKSPIRFFAWHYISGWGKRNGKWSKTKRQAQVKLDLSAIFHYLKLYVTPAHNDNGFSFYCDNAYGSPAVPYEIFANGIPYTDKGYCEITDGSRWGLIGGALFSLWWVFPYESANPDWPYNVTMEVVEYDATHWSHAYRAGSWSMMGGPGTMLKTYTGQMHENGEYHPPIYQGNGTGSSDWQVFLKSAPMLPKPSYWVYGDGLNPPGQENGSGVWRATYYNSGGCIVMGHGNADYTLYFRSGWLTGGALNNIDAYMDVKLVDPDNGILEIWGWVQGDWDTLSMSWKNKWNDLQLYFGDILLCDNINHETGSTYHHWLGISLLNLDGP